MNMMLVLACGGRTREVASGLRDRMGDAVGSGS
jgi:hypothetical protein